MGRLLAVLIASGLIATAVATAAADPATTAQADVADIEAVWGFSGGQIAYTNNGDGTYTGKVIRPTTLAQCEHPTGEEIDTGLTRQPDGQWFGRHQWFTGSCTPTEQRGNTAFRVLSKPDGAKFLRICFASDQQQDVQPTIAPDGTPANASGPCSDSELISALPAAKPVINDIATLPSSKKCRSRRNFRIRLKEPRGDALASAKVYVNRKLVKTQKSGRLTAPVDLRGLPKGRYTVRIIATTVLGKTIKGTRKYRTCAKRKRTGGNIRI